MLGVAVALQASASTTRQPTAPQEIVSAAIQKTLISCLPLLLHCKLGALAGTPAVLVAQTSFQANSPGMIICTLCGHYYISHDVTVSEAPAPHSIVSPAPLMAMVPARAAPVSSWGLPQTTAGSTDSRRRERAVHHRAFGPTTGISFARGLHNPFAPSGGGQVQTRKGQPHINHTVAAPAETVSISFAIYPIPLLHPPQEVDSALFDLCPYLYPNQAEFRIEGNGSALFGKLATFNLLFTLEVPADAGPFYQELHQRLVDHMDNNNLHFAPGSLPLMPNTHPIDSPPWHMQRFEELPWALQKAGNTPTKGGFARRFVPADISWHQFTSESLPKAAKPFLSPILAQSLVYFIGALLRAPAVSEYALQQMVPAFSSSTAPLFILDSPKLPLTVMEDDDSDPDFLQALALSHLDAVAVSNTQAGGSGVGHSSSSGIRRRSQEPEQFLLRILAYQSLLWRQSFWPANPADAATLQIPPGPFGLMSPTLSWMIGDGGSDTSSGISLGRGIGCSVMEGLMNVIFADEDIWKRVGDDFIIFNSQMEFLWSLTEILEAWPETVSKLAKVTDNANVDYLTGIYLDKQPNALLNMTQESYNAFGSLVQRHANVQVHLQPSAQRWISIDPGTELRYIFAAHDGQDVCGRLQKVEDLVARLHWVPCSDQSLVDLEEKYKAAFIRYISAPGIVRHPLLPVARLTQAEREITASNPLARALMFLITTTGTLQLPRSETTKIHMVFFAKVEEDERVLDPSNPAWLDSTPLVRIHSCFEQLDIPLLPIKALLDQPIPNDNTMYKDFDLYQYAMWRPFTKFAEFGGLEPGTKSLVIFYVLYVR
ncbi:hypothetical protein B0H17DRAFT_1146640 [Mycena rosella]|uniref:Uncharacterized protein n=1 Tax=Mycena rosella TaxID=1033263 RepID=A0AAD7CNP3_MYCRO|nr:hypothetical protein B0H17DRAFT_1146640 [Mycena rosella]